MSPLAKAIKLALLLVYRGNAMPKFYILDTMTGRIVQWALTAEKADKACATENMIVGWHRYAIRRDKGQTVNAL